MDFSQNVHAKHELVEKIRYSSHILITYTSNLYKILVEYGGRRGHAWEKELNDLNPCVLKH